MLRFVSLPVNAGGYRWSISPLTGNLLRSSDFLADENSRCPARVLAALDYVNSPYDLKPAQYVPREKCSPQRAPVSIAERLALLGNQRFFLSVIYAGLRHPLFENSSSGFATADNCGVFNRHSSCLQRCLFVAKTSRTFWDSGVLFIGAQLPTGSMHAWIIEGDQQPDLEDRIWINYRPLLAIF